MERSNARRFMNRGMTRAGAGKDEERRRSMKFEVRKVEVRSKNVSPVYRNRSSAPRPSTRVRISGSSITSTSTC
jgi:hypothetical protein